MSSPGEGTPAGAAASVAPLGWLRGYRKEDLPRDAVAGLTAAAVVLPMAMAYASVAGLPVQAGLYAALLPPILYAVSGQSSVLSVSTTSTIAIITGSALAASVPGADPGHHVAAAATLAVLVGLVLVAAAVLRLGFLANFISEPVLAGFKAGIGAVIVLDQLPKLLGFHVHKVGFIRDVVTVARSLGETSPPTLVLSACTLALLLALARWLPRLPAALFAVAGGIAASALLGLPGRGIPTAGDIPGGLPAFVLPELGLLEHLWPAALAIALMSFTETVAASRAFAGPDQPRPVPNRELVALGLANLSGGLTGALPSGGGTSQTLVNKRAGARTQLAGLVTGLAALATMLVLAPTLSRLPQAALSSIVLVYAIGLVSPRDFRAIAAIRRTELVWALTALAGVLLLGTLKGILVAVVTSLVSLAYQASNPPVYELVRKPGTNVFRRRTEEHPEDESWPGLLIVRVEGRLFFGNTELIQDRVAELARVAAPKVLLLDCAAIFDLEYSALRMLTEAEVRIRGRGGELWLSDLNPEARRVVDRSALGRALGRERMFFDLEHAVARYRERAAKG